MGRKPVKKGCNQYSGTKPKALAVRKRDAEAIKMRLSGSTLREICGKLGYSSVRHVRTAILRGLRYLAPPEEAEEMRRREVDRTFEIEAEAWEQWDRSVEDALKTVTKAAATEAKDAVGQPIIGTPITSEIVTTREGQSGNPALLGKILDAMERRAKLLGLDAPTTVDLNSRSEMRVIGCDPKEVLQAALSKLSKKS